MESDDVLNATTTKQDELYWSLGTTVFCQKGAGNGVSVRTTPYIYRLCSRLACLWLYLRFPRFFDVNENVENRIYLNPLNILVSCLLGNSFLSLPREIFPFDINFYRKSDLSYITLQANPKNYLKAVKEITFKNYWLIWVSGKKLLQRRPMWSHSYTSITQWSLDYVDHVPMPSSFWLLPPCTDRGCLLIDFSH